MIVSVVPLRRLKLKSETLLFEAFGGIGFCVESVFFILSNSWLLSKAAIRFTVTCSPLAPLDFCKNHPIVYNRIFF